MTTLLTAFIGATVGLWFTLAVFVWTEQLPRDFLVHGWPQVLLAWAVTILVATGWVLLGRALGWWT